MELVLLAQCLRLVALLGALHTGGHLVPLRRAHVHPRLHLAERLACARLGRGGQLLALRQLRRRLDGSRDHLPLLLTEHAELAPLRLEALGGLRLACLPFVGERLQLGHRLLQRLHLAQHLLVLGLLLVKLLEAAREAVHPLLS